MSMPNPITNPKIEKVRIEDIRPREGNPNQMSDEQFESLEYSVEKYGYIQPIIVDQFNTIVDGEHRFMALREKGIEEIDVVRVNLKDDNERRLLSQTLNKLRGKHDPKKDVTELELLMGYNPIELQSLLSFDETGLDLLRQQVAEEDSGSEKEQVEFEATKRPYTKEIKHEESQTQCPSCGHIF